MTHLIGIKELADHLNISVKTLRVRVSKGKIAQPVKREGDELFWDRKAVGVEPLDIYGAADDLTYALPAGNPNQFGDPDLLLGRSKPHPADFEINVQPDGGLRREDVHVIMAKSRKDKSEYMWGTDPQTLDLAPTEGEAATGNKK